MLRPYVVQYKFKRPADKKPGAVKIFLVYACDLAEARRLVSEQATYPDIEVLDVRPA